MKKTYKDLNLRGLGKMFNLDFVHYTYLPNQCSCCYGPEHIPQGWLTEAKENPKYLLFKNADNGSGVVKWRDFLKESEYISHDNLSFEELESISKELSKRLGEGYVVLTPKVEYLTIIILEKYDDNGKVRKIEESRKDYKVIQYE